MKDNPYPCGTPEYQRVWYLVRKKGLSMKEAVEKVQGKPEQLKEIPLSEELPNIFTNCQYLLIIGHLKRIDENQNKIMSKLGLKPPFPGPASLPGGDDQPPTKPPLLVYHCLTCGLAFLNGHDDPQPEPYSCPECGGYRITFTRGYIRD